MTLSRAVSIHPCPLGHVQDPPVVINLGLSELCIDTDLSHCFYRSR